MEDNTDLTTTAAELERQVEDLVAALARAKVKLDQLIKDAGAEQASLNDDKKIHHLRKKISAIIE